MPEPRRWEVERDRFGLMISPEIAVGECIDVIEAGPVHVEFARLRRIEDAARQLMAMPNIRVDRPGRQMSPGEAVFAGICASLRDALEASA